MAKGTFFGTATGEDPGGIMRKVLIYKKSGNMFSMVGWDGHEALSHPSRKTTHHDICLEVALVFHIGAVSFKPASLEY